MKDLISIIIPAYNIENEIERCVNSVLAQTYSNIEVIIVNEVTGNHIRETSKLKMFQVRLKEMLSPDYYRIREILRRKK